MIVEISYMTDFEVSDTTWDWLFLKWLHIQSSIQVVVTRWVQPHIHLVNWKKSKMDKLLTLDPRIH